MIYIFHRSEGFYPLSLGSDAEAIANAEVNPGTLKVTDSENRVVFDASEATCDRCNGSGETAVMTHGRGPDDYEVSANCPECNGTGVPAPGPDAPTSQIEEPVPGILPVKESDHV